MFITLYFYSGEDKYNYLFSLTINILKQTYGYNEIRQ